MDCYFLRKVLIVIIILFLIAIISYHYVKHRLKLKMAYCHTKNIKVEHKESKEVSIKNSTCYYFDDTTKIEDFDFDNILIDEKSYKDILVYIISYKPF